MIRSDCRQISRKPFKSVLFEPLETRQLFSITAPMTAVPMSVAGPMATSSPAGNPVGFSPAQIRHAFGIDAISFGRIAGDGTGQTIAIVNAFDNPRFVNSNDPGFANSDLHRFDVEFGLPDPPLFTKVDQFGQSPKLGTDPFWARETALDVEWIHAIAPKANILLVEAKSASLDDLINQPDGAHIQGAVEYARSQPGVSVVTMSFASKEGPRQMLYDPTLVTPPAHDGITFVASAGDSGAPGGYPAFSPTVLSVGGTSLTLDGSNYVSEIGLASGGGGISQLESKPSFQSSINLGNGRLSPDVSFDSDPNTGVAVFDSFNGGAATPWFELGGTSLSAPAWSALLAVTNQGRATRSMGSLDGVSQTLPRLYQLNTADFHDVTSGNNGFPATAGFDLVTGRGTPKANTLVPHLAGANDVSGVMFNDANGNGVKDSGEGILAGWGAFVDFNNNGVRDGNDMRAVSDSTGKFAFTDLPGGTFHINQVTPAGWKRTTAAISVSLNFGTVITNKNIGNQPPDQRPGSLSGVMFNDRNGNGVFDPAEQPLVGWGCYLDFNNDGIFDGNDRRVFSNASGAYSFTNLPSNVTYHLRQNTPTSWRRTTPNSIPFNFTLQPAAANKVNIGNTQASLSGTVFNDSNGNARRDTGETGLAGWGVFLDANNNQRFDVGETRVFTDASGNYSFFGLLAGTYHVNEGIPTGWRRTLPSLAGYTIALATGQIVKQKDIGNAKT